MRASEVASRINLPGKRFWPYLSHICGVFSNGKVVDCCGYMLFTQWSSLSFQFTTPPPYHLIVVSVLGVADCILSYRVYLRVGCRKFLVYESPLTFPIAATTEGSIDIIACDHRVVDCFCTNFYSANYNGGRVFRSCHFL